MKRLRAALAFAVVALTFTAIASAAKPAKWNHMTLKQKERVVLRQIERHRSKVRWWIGMRERNAPVGFRVLLKHDEELHTVWCPAVGLRAPVAVCSAAVKMRHGMTVLERIRSQLRAQDAARARAKALAAMPEDCRGGASVAACAWYEDGATQCEVSHEGGWTTDSNYPYAGRFQMDQSFETGTPFGQSMENLYGRASNWPPWAQIQHAYEEFLSRGWNPWPPYYHYGCSAYHGGSYI